MFLKQEDIVYVYFAMIEVCTCNPPISKSFLLFWLFILDLTLWLCKLKYTLIKISRSYRKIVLYSLKLQLNICLSKSVKD